MEPEAQLPNKLVRPSLIKIKDVKATKTTDFILPLYGFTKNYYSPFLVNAYLGDKDTGGIAPEQVLLLLSNHRMDLKYARIEDTLKSLPEYIDYYDVLDSRMTLFILHAPFDFLDEYHLFVQGKYSKFSEKAQVKIIKGRSPDSSMPYIFKKDPVLKNYWETKLKAELDRDAEVWPILTAEEEIFDKSKFLKNT